MNYIFLIVGLIAGIIYLGIAKNINRRKTVPYEVTKNLRTHKRMDEYNEWCDTEVVGDRLVGIGFLLIGFSVTFMDSVPIVGGVLSIVALVLFILGYFKRINNNKKHLGHFFVR